MNTPFQSLVDEFLNSKRIAVVGYSRKAGVANGIYDKFKKHGYEVFAVTPKASEFTEIQAWSDLKSIAGSVDAVMICTPPAASADVIQEAADLGIPLVWIHRSVDGGSYSAEAEKLAHERGLKLIPFGCPMMFLKPDIFHGCMKWFFNMQGKFKVAES